MIRDAGNHGVRRRCGSRAVAAIAGLVALAATLAGCSSGAATGAPASAAAPSFPAPLATSVQAFDGSWATVAMGHPGQPTNTFWQLLFWPAGKARWSNRVEATATATNGGLVLAPGGRSLTVAVRPSADLTFTPLISTSGSATSWSNGLISAGLAARPDALALGQAAGRWRSSTVGAAPRCSPQRGIFRRGNRSSTRECWRGRRRGAPVASARSVRSATWAPVPSSAAAAPAPVWSGYSPGPTKAGRLTGPSCPRA